jgi:hypothetical protein
MDEFSKHEALDRSFLVMEMFNRYVLDHPSVEIDPELKIFAEQVSQNLYDFYNTLAQKYIIKDLSNREINTD